MEESKTFNQLFYYIIHNCSPAVSRIHIELKEIPIIGNTHLNLRVKKPLQDPPWKIIVVNPVKRKDIALELLKLFNNEDIVTRKFKSIKIICYEGQICPISKDNVEDYDKIYIFGQLIGVKRSKTSGLLSHVSISDLSFKISNIKNSPVILTEELSRYYNSFNYRRHTKYNFPSDLPF